jgi:hypothetical protein
VSTINSYAWYLQAIPSKFSCVIFQKKPSKYFLFCDTVFSSWGRSGRICYLPYCFIQKEKIGKKKEKRHSSMVCESWWAPDGIGYPWFVKGKGGEECQAL